MTNTYSEMQASELRRIAGRAVSFDQSPNGVLKVRGEALSRVSIVVIHRSRRNVEGFGHRGDREPLSGLQAAHGQGLVHGTVDPGTILLERDTDRAMLIDFGIARVQPAATGQPTANTGSEAVAYPVSGLADARPADEQSDLYALGVTAQIMLGRPGSGVREGLSRGLHAPHIPEALAFIIARMLTHSGPERYQSADEVLDEMRALDDDGSTSDGPSPPVWKPAGSTRLPELSPAVAAWLDPTRWQAFRLWAWNRFLARAPQVVRNLQNTEQYVDFAVAQYQLRCDELDRQVEEGEGIAEELAAQKRA